VDIAAVIAAIDWSAIDWSAVLKWAADWLDRASAILVAFVIRYFLIERPLQRRDKRAELTKLDEIKRTEERKVDDAR
jgi:hypothetical protein